VSQHIALSVRQSSASMRERFTFIAAFDVYQHIRQIGAIHA
jgi:hypothetical protein